jgi:hypothetical protein
MMAALVLVTSMLSTTMSSQAQTASSDSVGLPGGGVSAWDGVIAPIGAPAPAFSVSSVDSGSVALAGDTTRLHVKFHEGAGISWVDGVLDDGADNTALDALLQPITRGSVTPLFRRDPESLMADRVRAEARTGKLLPDLTTWFLITASSTSEGRALRDDLQRLDIVEMVQPEPTLMATQPSEETLQGYLDASPDGINAEWAWGQVAGTATNVTIAVIDSGFDTAHGDLDRASMPGVVIPHEAPWASHHGLQVLGILAADDDGQGIRGIAHDSGLHTVNSGRSSGEVANAIDLASAALGPGDVITISQGICAVTGCVGDVVLPLVYSSSARDALRVVAASGVITVVSGGNGGANLNSYSSRLGTDAPDSIVVGAGNPPPVSDCVMEDGPSRGRVSSSNYGSRVDLQGWGACVRTTLQGGGYKWWGFTSAATPIVAGSAALVSSMAQQRLGRPLTGSQIRALLIATGSPQITLGTRGGNIGPLPNVRDAIASLSLLPDNDMWADAQVVEAVPFSATADARFAGVELDEPPLANKCGPISHTTWYRYAPTADIEVTIDTRGSSFDTTLGLWRLDGSSLARAGCADDITVNNGASELTRLLQGGETYYIQAGGNDGADGTLKLNISIAGYTGVGCDINGDGYGDLVSGSPGEDVRSRVDAGRALVHWGRSNTKLNAVTSVTQEWPGLPGGSENGDGFGAAVACGDFDGDGHDDLAIGAPFETTGGKRNSGAVRVIHGSSGGLSKVGSLTITQRSPGVAGVRESGDWFGSSLAVGDFDGDGFADLAIGASGEDIGSRKNAGGVHILYGSESGLQLAGFVFFHGNTKRLPNFAEAGDRFGARLVSADFNGNGYDDLVIGVPAEDLNGVANAGAVLVLRGGTSGVTADGAMILHQDVDGVAGSPERGDRFGDALAAGDIDGDGHADLVVGVPGEGLSGNRNAGMLHVFSGGPLGLSGQASTNIHQDVDGIRGRLHAGDAFASALGVGDVNRDGFADLAVGVPGESVGSVADAGVVHVFDGTSAGITAAGDQVIHQDSRGIAGKAEAGDRFGSALAMVDLGGDGRIDVVVGVPHEGLAGKDDVGNILILPGASRGVSRAASVVLTQRSPNTGGNERGGRFGEVFGSS